MKVPSLALAGTLVLSSLAGCTHHPAARPEAKAVSASRPISHPLPAADLTKFKPNEVGVVPILEYHDVGNESRWGRSAANFRRDLNRLYSEGYRPITMAAFADNRIDLPAGKSPVILTFDDARESQFRYLPGGKLDPNSAFGILQDFHRIHPDFPGVAIFYMLPQSAFGPIREAKQKVAELLKAGCEIGNHTVSHPLLKKLSDEKVREEIGNCARMLHDLAPDATVDSLALPFGSQPRNRALLPHGEWKGFAYKNRTVLLVGSEPSAAPASVKFNPMRVPRIQAVEGPSGITFWLDELKRHKARRYVSDGDPMAITVPNSALARVDRRKLQGMVLRTY